jgi:hypothetical protein
MLAKAMRRRPSTAAAAIDIAALTVGAVVDALGRDDGGGVPRASAWAEVTLVPYLYSVAYLDSGDVACDPAADAGQAARRHSAFALVALRRARRSAAGPLAAIARDGCGRMQPRRQSDRAVDVGASPDRNGGDVRQRGRGELGHKCEPSSFSSRPH